MFDWAIELINCWIVLDRKCSDWAAISYLCFFRVGLGRNSNTLPASCSFRWLTQIDASLPLYYEVCLFCPFSPLQVISSAIFLLFYFVCTKILIDLKTLEHNFCDLFNVIYLGYQPYHLNLIESPMLSQCYETSFNQIICPNL